MASYDVVEISEANAASLGYEPADAGIAVQRDGEFIAWADDLRAAAALIAERTGNPVTLRPAAANYGPRWIPA